MKLFERHKRIKKRIIQINEICEKLNLNALRTHVYYPVFIPFHLHISEQTKNYERKL